MQEWDRERPGALLARRTRGLGRPSFDARSRGQPWPLPPIQGRRRGRRKERREAYRFLVLAQRAIAPPSLHARTLGTRQATPYNGRGEKAKEKSCAPILTSKLRWLTQFSAEVSEGIGHGNLRNEKLGGKAVTVA